MFAIQTRRPRRQIRPTLDGLPTRIMPTDLGSLQIIDSAYVRLHGPSYEGEGASQSPNDLVTCIGPAYSC